MMRILSLSLVFLLTACSVGKAPQTVNTPPPVAEGGATPLLETSVKWAVAPDDLIGKTPAEVIKMMGSPSFVRRDKLVQHMLFKADVCVLDVVYYADSLGAPYVASFVSARKKDGGAQDAGACLTAHLPTGWPSERTLDAADIAQQTATDLQPVEVSEQ